MEPNLAAMVARDILRLEAENELLRWENNELRDYKQKYFDLLNADIKHGEQMIATVVTALVNPGSTLNK